MLVDGVRVQDLQTAHHNLDIPVPIESIERIEILYGGLTSIYGSDGFGGVINILTKNTKKNNFSTKFSFYDFNTKTLSSSLSLKSKKISYLFALENNSSDGFMEDRDFNILNLLNKFNFDFEKTKISFLLSYGEKEFGAYDFYTPGYCLPSRENTKTKFLNLDIKKNIGSFEVLSNIFYREHFDDFILNRKNPSYYENKTKNYYGGINISLTNKKNIALGIEYLDENILGTKIGEHKNGRSSLFFEISKEIKDKIFLNLSLRDDLHSKYGSFFSPNFSISYPFKNNKIFISLGKSFRAPSYTELYYKDPVNFGNENLKPEESKNYEAGFEKYIKDNLKISFNFFIRDEKDLIDWVKREKFWYAENIESMKMKGAEFSLKYDFNNFSIDFNSSFLKAEKEKNIQLKYGFRYPKILLNLNTCFKILKKISSSIQFIYKNRVDENDFILIDGKIEKSFKNFSLFLVGKNLSNERCQEIKGVDMPPRYFGVGIKLMLF